MTKAIATRIEEVETMLAAIPALKAGSENAHAFGSEDLYVRTVGRCGVTLHEGCAVARIIAHEGRDIKTILQFFAAAPGIVRALLAEREELKATVRKVTLDGADRCNELGNALNENASLRAQIEELRQQVERLRGDVKTAFNKGAEEGQKLAIADVARSRSRPIYRVAPKGDASLREQLAASEREREESRTQLEAWFSVFGTTQLTHARARLESAEEKAAHSQQQEGR